MTAPYVLDPTWSGDVTDLADDAAPARVTDSATLVAGRVWDIRRDTVELPDGQQVVRDIVLHPGAVAVIALDDDDRVFLLRQYRHPTAEQLWEPVAGLLDVDGEPPQVTAARELVEEAGLQAEEWHVLLDFFTSPGGSSESIRVFLARGLSPVAGGRPPGVDEEADLPHTWVALDTARELVLAGRIGSPTAVSGILAAHAARGLGWTTLRAADTPWPAREVAEREGRVRRSG